jgi:nitroreductase
VLEPSKNVERVQKLKREHGVPAAKVVNMPRDVRLFSRHGLDADADAPLSAPTIAWAFKQTTFAAATLLFAAEELGLGSCPMEGFDEALLRRSLEIPERYAIPVIIAVGYPTEGPQPHATPRLPPTEVIFDGKFGRPSDSLFLHK